MAKMYPLCVAVVCALLLGKSGAQVIGVVGSTTFTQDTNGDLTISLGTVSTNTAGGRDRA